MKISTRTLLIIGATIFTLILAMALVAQFFILSSYSKVEDEQSITNVELVNSQIKYQIDTLGESVHVLAARDDTYQFMIDRNPAFFASVIEPTSLYENLQIDGVLIYDAEGNLVASRGFNSRDPANITISPEVLSLFSQGRSILPNVAGKKKKQGMVLLSRGPAMVAMHTILPSSGTGDGRGTLVFVRTYDDASVLALQSQVRLPVKLLDLNDPSLLGDPRVVLLEGPKTPPAIVNTIVDDSTIAGSSLISDIDNNPILLLQVNSPRHMNEQAKSTILFLILSFLFIGSICILVINALLRKYVIAHLVGLDASMKEIGEHRDLGKRLFETGDDEIASLKKSMNGMLQELQDKELGREQDIRELNRMGDTLRVANRKLNLLNNIIRHDILNTVTGLLGLEDMVMEQEPGVDSSELIREIRNSTKQIQRQITFTREYQDVGVKAALWQNIEEVVDYARASLDLRGVTVVVDTKDAEIFADPLLEKVFYNLMDNAIHYGEKITTIRFSYRIAEKGLVLVCEDDGMGIKEREKEQVFERGFGRNTGQGLFLVREILDITGISITETGTYGVGARFEMFIPPGAFRLGHE